MMTSVATTTTTRPIASHVKSPAGRPADGLAGRRFGAFPGADVRGARPWALFAAAAFFLAGVLATMLLVMSGHQT